MAIDKSPRHRFQFRLRTLMIIVTLVAMASGHVGWQARIVRERKATLAQMIDAKSTERGGYAWGDAQVPWIRRILGDRAVRCIGLPITATKDFRQRLRATFPEARVGWFDTSDFTIKDFPGEPPKQG
jgi:hypothetical protein